VRSERSQAESESDRAQGTGGQALNRITQITIPSLVRVKPGAIDRLGLYLKRSEHTPTLLLVSQGLVPDYLERVQRSLAQHGIECLEIVTVGDASFENAMGVFTRLPGRLKAVVGLGGGKALDVAKYVAFLARLPYYAAPTSLSNDGFCSPQSSLTVAGKRRSLAAALPFAVVLDLEVCKNAPRPLWLSGVGDLVSKLTAIFDWKLAFHRRGEPVNDKNGSPTFSTRWDSGPRSGRTRFPCRNGNRPSTSPRPSRTISSRSSRKKVPSWKQRTSSIMTCGSKGASLANLRTKIGFVRPLDFALPRLKCKSAID
jgi:hypothetical protein